MPVFSWHFPAEHGHYQERNGQPSMTQINDEPGEEDSPTTDARECLSREERSLETDARFRQLLERRVQERTKSLNSMVATLQKKVTQQAVLAIQFSQLAEQARQEAVQEERNRLAREIHDTLAQTFTGILIQLGVAQRIAKQQPDDAWHLVDRVAGLARQGLTEARRTVWALQPNIEKYTDFAQMLPELLQQMTEETNITTQIQIHGTPQLLGSEITQNLLRIVQEAVNNTLHHAHARQIRIDLTFESEQVNLTITDDGRGFDLNRGEESGGFGLQGMHQRAERIGGRWTIATQPGQGTCVTVFVPLSPRQREEEEKCQTVT